MYKAVICGQSTDRRLRDSKVPVYEGNNRFPSNRDVNSPQRARDFASKLEVSNHISQIYTVTNSTWNKIIFFSNMQNSTALIKAIEADICILDTGANDLTLFDQVSKELVYSLAHEVLEFALYLNHKLTIINAIIPCRTGNLKRATSGVYWKNAELYNDKMEELCANLKCSNPHVYFNPLRALRYKELYQHGPLVPVTADEVLTDNIHPNLDLYWAKVKHFTLKHMCTLQGKKCQKRNRGLNHKNARSNKKLRLQLQ